MPDREIDVALLEERLDRVRRDVTVRVSPPPVARLSRRVRGRRARRFVAGGAVAALATAGILVFLPGTTGPVHPPVAGKVPADAFLTPDDARTSVGAYLSGEWAEPSRAPRPLPRAKTCAPDLPSSTSRVLVARAPSSPDPVLRSSITLARDTASATARAREAERSLLDCAGHELGRPVRVSRSEGGALVAGSTARHVEGSVAFEYVLVARAGRAVEVTTLQFAAQDVPPAQVLQRLAETALQRLDEAG